MFKGIVMLGGAIFVLSFIFIRRFLKQRQKRRSLVLAGGESYADLVSEVEFLRKKTIPALKKEIDSMKLEMDAIRREVDNNRFSVKDMSSRVHYIEKYK
ncbi:MAG: hypothetical protein GY793_07625 [Proteobacteria bacterium]|nr:hypothetical protein [Pseudomonadota bacterium]